MRYVSLALLFCCSLYSSWLLADYDNGMRYAFVASQDKRSVSIIDLHDQRLAESVPLNYQPGVIEASDRLDALVIAHPVDKRLSLIDLSSSNLKQVDYPLQITPDHIKLNPIGDTVAVYDQQQQIIQVHDLKRRRVLLQVDDVHTGELLTFNRDGQRIFWVDRQAGTLKTSDLWNKQGEVKLTTDGDGLSAMTRSVDGSIGFISDALTAKVYVVNLRSLQRVNIVPVGNRPGRAWGTADGQHMLIPNYADGSITAISTFTLNPL